MPARHCGYVSSTDTYLRMSNSNDLYDLSTGLDILTDTIPKI